MEGAEKKEYLILDGKPVLAHAIQPFLESDFFSHVFVTLPHSHIDRVSVFMAPYLDISRLVFVAGGQTRQASVFLALLELERFMPDYVLIHDGARPWIDIGTIKRVMDGTVKKGACLPVVKSRDALKELGSEGLIERHLDRERVAGAQTPQGFEYPGLLKAHKKAHDDDFRHFTDDGEVYATYIGPVFTVEGNVTNRKITYPFDLEVAAHEPSDALNRVGDSLEMESGRPHPDHTDSADHI
jgi:2-C-methyl-D-erythritol 4-phosphate cytidylyltransferase